MGFTGIWQWVIVLAIVLILFGGRGKISGLMGDFGKGLRSFKKSMKDDDTAAKDGDDTKAIDSEAAAREEASEKDKTAQG